MTQVVVPIRYPISEHSKRTLKKAIEVANEHDGHLTILHVNLYQGGQDVSRSQLKRSVEEAFGHLDKTRYVVRRGFLVEETILNEIAAERADIVVIGRKQVNRWRSTIRRLVGDPDIEAYLREELDAQIVTAGD